MKYLLLLYGGDLPEPQPGTPEFGQMMQDYDGFNALLERDGIDWSGEALEDAGTATSLRKRGGRVETMDGPFAETKEQLGGFYLIDVPDLDAAMRYAAEIPAARYGTVEIRPIMDTAPLLPGG
ncbi:YciI family protein [Pararhodobacter aggregans]